MRISTWQTASVLGGTILGACFYVAVANVASAQERTVIPGTGVTMTLPEGVTVSPLGTTFSDADREVTVSVVVGPSSKDMRESVAFPDAGEPFRTSTITGEIYKRARSEGHGAWDGWLLKVSRGGKSLDVLISYTGPERGRFQELKTYLSTVSWNDAAVDPEISFGLKMNVSGLRLIPDVAGALGYSADGKPSQHEPSMYVTAVGIGLNGDMVKFRQLCEKDATVIAGDKPVPVRYQSKSNTWVCDAWKQFYVAVLMLPDGSVAQVVAQGNPDVFQAALLNAQEIPRPRALSVDVH
jgi:hypothetical protein